ncbi:unnamed protein product [Linum trigynum]|uniref:GPI-anchored protein LLG1-like domain-containing protein n=1 Tax=Linum trigynum TaxID=586398 RepID=A0AAV2DRG7_9ROSI
MANHRYAALCFYLTCFLLFIGFAHCNQIPYSVFVPSSWKAASRSLLQGVDSYHSKAHADGLLPCNISFDTMDYTVFGKGCGEHNREDQHAPRKTCCAAWMLFICPVRDYIKDMGSLCRMDMFWNAYHQYRMDQEYFIRFCIPPGHDVDCGPVDELREQKGKKALYDPLARDQGVPDVDLLDEAAESLNLPQSLSPRRQPAPTRP